MKLSEQEYNLIQKFLGNTLLPKELVVLKEKLDNPLFRKELEYQTSLLDALITTEDNKLKALLKSGNKIKPVSKPTLFKFKAIYKYAAVLLFLLSIGFVLKWTLFPNDIQKVIAEHSYPFPPEIIQRGAESKFTKSYKEAMGYYANENYALANNLFLDLNPQSERIILYRANCLISLKKYEEAKSLLLSIINSSSIEIQQNAQWYLTLSYYGVGNKKEGRRMLKSILTTEDHLFGNKAKELKSDL